MYKQIAECKIYGAYYCLPLVNVAVKDTGMTGTVQLPGGATRELPIATNDAQRIALDSCLIAWRNAE